MPYRSLCLLSAFLGALAARPGWGFNPPTETVGALTARIEGPGEVTRADVPLALRVVVQNRGRTPLSGTVALRVIDRWAAQPVAPVRFTAAPSSTSTYEFKITVDAGSYHALYPIRADVDFTENGRQQGVRPVLIVPVRLPRPAVAATPVSWRPYEIPSVGHLALGTLPAFRGVVQVFGRPARTLPVGRQGRDEATYAVIEVRRQALDHVSREVVAIHPPWRDGQVGTAWVEFPLAMPTRGPIRLQFDDAVAPDGTGDGVTFRVRAVPFDAPDGALGEVVYERHGRTKRWGSANVANLDRWAGRAIRLQLESHPGPKKDTSFDQSFWGDPTLVSGSESPPAAFPPANEQGSETLDKIQVGNRRVQVRIWPGRRGLLDAVIGFVDGDRSLYVRGVEARVLGQQIDDDRSLIRLSSVEPAREGKAYRVRHRFKAPDAAFDLVGRVTVDDGALRLSLALENVPAAKPWKAVVLEDVALGPWSRTARQVYAGHGNVVREPSAFSLDFDGHRLATSFVGFEFNGGPAVVQAVDAPPTRLEVNPSAKRYSLHAAPGLTFTVIPTSNVFDGARHWHDINGLKPSAGVRTAAGRFVFDLWGGQYGASASALRRSFRYGLGDSLVVWHNWQRWGYDYRLPDIYPPNPELGTPEELKDLIAACRGSGTLFALHDNYIDFYPDADAFSYEQNIAFNADRQPVPAWLNEGRGAQSYRFRADRIEPFLVRNLRLVREGLAPSAYFLDVWSSIRPYEYWTSDGRFVDRTATRDAWGKLFARIRNELGGDAPQISESGHDQLIGWLDGAQTNHLRVGRPIAGPKQAATLWDWRCEDAERTPWFDAAHHDRFVLHGAGYPGRYEAGLDSREHGISSDDYVATEVLTGHPAMVAAPFGPEVVRMHWLTNALMRALALQRIERVEYVGDDLHRQHVRWSGGGDVWVNRGETDWKVGKAVLPPFGFLARVASAKGPVEASITRRDGLIVEEARSVDQWYVNARGTGGPLRIEPSASEVRLTGGRNFTLAVRWQADDPIPEGYQPFFHLVDVRGEIAFQVSQAPGATRDPATKAIRAMARGSIPESVTPGATFELRAGLYDPKTGKRLILSGTGDGESRVRLGTLRVEGRDRRLTGLGWTARKPVPDPVLARQNPRQMAIDFGVATTSGGARLMREGDALTITPLPSEGGRTFDLNVRLSRLPWAPVEPTRVEAIAEDGRVLDSQPVHLREGRIALTCRPGVFQYRVVGADAK